MGLTYDTGALLAAEANNVSLWALHKRTLARQAAPVVPTVVLAQAWRGGPQPLLSRLLRGCEIEPFLEPLARSVGTALAAAGSRDIVDAAVVLSALKRQDVVVTSDHGDIRRITEALGCRLDVHPI
jgi:hypothetical protein